MSAAAVTLGRLRVADVRRDPLATRVALDRALAGATLAPRALPPAAILVVRRLHDPLPRRLALDRGALRPPPEWERAVAASLDELARGAAHPAHEPVPADAAAVVFADRAELLACLLRDWAAGALGGRWWWLLLVRGERDAHVAAELRAAAAYVPAAFELLADRGAAVEVAAAIPPAAARAAAEGVALTFGLRVPPASGAASWEPRRPPAEGAEDAAAAAGPARAGAPAPDVRQALPEGELARHAPEARSAALRPEQRALLALALTLRRAPAALVRAAPAPAPPTVPTPGAERAPMHPAAKGHRLPPEPPEAPLPRSRAPKTASPGAAARSRGGPASPARGSAPTPAPEQRAGTLPAEEGEAAPRGGEPAAPARPTARPSAAEGAGTVRREEREADLRPPPAGAPPFAAPARSAEPAPAPGAPPGAAPRPQPPPALAPRPEDDGARPLGPAIATGLGGLLFLVNAAIDLGLYGDFTEPARPGIGLDLWDFLTLAGRELLGGADDDAVWALLAQLARRDPEEPAGGDFVPPSGAPLEAWTRDVAEEVRGLLAQTGLAPARLLRRPALVHVTEAHVDGVFALADHPLEIRVAGLDRDPGFVPAAGRHVAFHFE